MLKYTTPRTWTDTVLANLDLFLLDHAACEKKASSMAMSMVSHYADKPELIKAMVDLAIEELTHYREVIKIIHERKLHLSADQKDPYVTRLRQHIRHGREAYLLDRLLIAAVIEARGHERFGLIAADLPAGKLKRFYQSITKSEEKHSQLFIDLARRYVVADEVNRRLNELLELEAGIIAELPIRAALH